MESARAQRFALRAPHSPNPSLPEGERGTRRNEHSLLLFFSLLSLGERRAGEVRVYPAGAAGVVATGAAGAFGALSVNHLSKSAWLKIVR